MIIRDHALERFWLERRLDLLSKLDDLAHSHFYCSDENTQAEDDRQIALLGKEYAEVRTPYDLEKEIKRIYSPVAYGGPNKSKKSGKTIR